MVSRVEIYSGVDITGRKGYLRSFQLSWRLPDGNTAFKTLADSSGMPVNLTAFGVDGDLTVASVAVPNLVVKQLRIFPTGWSGSACLRLELFGPDTGTLPYNNSLLERANFVTIFPQISIYQAPSQQAMKTKIKAFTSALSSLSDHPLFNLIRLGTFPSVLVGLTTSCSKRCGSRLKCMIPSVLRTAQ